MVGEGAWIFKQLFENCPLFCCRQRLLVMSFLFCWLRVSDGLSKYLSDGESRNWHVRLVLSATFDGYQHPQFWRLSSVTSALSCIQPLNPLGSQHPWGKTTCLYLINLRTGGDTNLFWFDILGVTQLSLDLCAFPALTGLKKLFRLLLYFFLLSYLMWNLAGITAPVLWRLQVTHARHDEIKLYFLGMFPCPISVLIIVLKSD